MKIEWPQDGSDWDMLPDEFETNFQKKTKKTKKKKKTTEFFGFWIMAKELWTYINKHLLSSYYVPALRLCHLRNWYDLALSQSHVEL